MKRGFMETETIEQIRKFVVDYIASTKRRSKVHGSFDQIESQWWVLDFIFLFLENIPKEEHQSFNMGTFGVLKGFSAKSWSRIIEEKRSKDPYGELVKLRNEYEEWRDKKIEEFKKSGK
jgi:hypothetical protein